LSGGEWRIAIPKIGIVEGNVLDALAGSSASIHYDRVRYLSEVEMRPIIVGGKRKGGS